jgi:hypothetical protein
MTESLDCLSVSLCAVSSHHLLRKRCQALVTMHYIDVHACLKTHHCVDVQNVSSALLTGIESRID